MSRPDPAGRPRSGPHSGGAAGKTSGGADRDDCRWSARYANAVVSRPGR
ncbi:hypothetical protein ebA884 [Aromatoleum aromaticum EbN1]|uniref:Uncharacterized protein n=1 Tax=Aromatoleum aromaticum (strain DSM 19018 / LMG 30748 / EbN1) TaxID=76114 RepID=Q5P7W6_AROAE|nr:hypothetical protein ebA884 [Aromatoleum aromaticum EbN1]